MTNERHEKALEAAYAAAMVFKGSNPRDEMATVIAAYLQAMDAVIVPREPTVEMKLFGSEQFDQRPSEAKQIFEAMLSKAPNHFTNGE